MTRYIDKDALVSEIERRINFNEKLNAHSRLDECNAILSFIDTLEVKEVNLDVMQRMEECPYRRVGCTMYADKILECKGACS